VWGSGERLHLRTTTSFGLWSLGLWSAKSIAALQGKAAYQNFFNLWKNCDTGSLYSIPNSLASAFHFPSTSARVFASITISSGHGRVNPSVDHLRVASIPIFDP
jgi:hypothetical protein